MDKDMANETTPQRKLDFFPQEADTEKELVDDGNGEDIIRELQSVILEEKIPKVGMEFDSEEEAYTFYNEYAKLTGFSIRRHTIHKDISGRIVDRTFVCSCQGHRTKDKRDCASKSHRPETRNGCGAMMKIDGRHSDKYKIIGFVADHTSHDLVSPSKSHCLRSHRTITAIQSLQADDLDSSGIGPKTGFALMTKQMGGRENVGFTLQDYKNYLRSKRTREMKIGDTGGVLEYLQQKQLHDPNFFYAIQVDVSDLIANIIWVDSRMMIDYAHFGDVVCFDTTYKKNKDGRPFALFVGVNHHKQTIIFGAALLYDETAATFCWLFDTFARAMNGKQPRTILTDQDAAMAKALAIKWPDTCHRLCIWHIYQNAAIHLSSVFAGFKSFSKDFSSCIYDYEEEEEFFDAWHKMLEKYGLQSNEWLERLFKIREKWALVYGRRSFCADMTTTQRSESINGVLKRYVSHKHNLLQFFHHFDRLLDDRRYEEVKADIRSSQSTPMASFPVQILKHAASIYTHEVFELFQEELQKAYDSKLVLSGEIGETFEYKVTPFGKKHHHTVRYVLTHNKVSCSCKKFEFAGILCSHTLKVLSSRDILKIPELYIEKRWTKTAKKNIVESHFSTAGVECSPSMNEIDEKKVRGVRFRELCSLNNQLATRAALTMETFFIVRNGYLKLMEEVSMSLENKQTVTSSCRQNSTLRKDVSRVVANQKSGFEVCEKQNIIVSCDTEQGLEEQKHLSDETMIRGWKKKEKKPVRSGKRVRSGLEKSKQRKKQKQEPNDVKRSDFRHGFLFGAASSSYQVEGAVLEDGRSLSNWDLFCHIEGNIEDGSNADTADDHYHRYMEDIEIMHSLGLSAYRFSISWSRVLPRGRLGEVNHVAILFYNKIIDNLLLRGIQPVVTIFHHEYPQELEDRFKGWLSPLMQEEYLHFAEVCFQNFADRVRYWITINEPNLYAEMSYERAIYPPARCSPPFGNCATGNSDIEPLIVVHNMLLAHAKAAKLYRDKFKTKFDGLLSIAACAMMYVPMRDCKEDNEAANRALAFNSAWVLDPLVFGDYPPEMKRLHGNELPRFTLEEKELLRDSIDFIGLNHYGTLYAKDCLHSTCHCNASSCAEGSDRAIRGFVFLTGERNGVPIGEPTGMNRFFVVPEGMEGIIRYVKERYHNKPMVVTENGYSSLGNEENFQHDIKRIHFHRLYLAYLAQAIRNGADVRGYLMWTLMDNFEWTSGYSLKFGLYSVERETMKRTPKLSAFWYRDFLANFSLVHDANSEVQSE